MNQPKDEDSFTSPPYTMAFVIDCTGSMEVRIRQVLEVIVRMVTFFSLFGISVSFHVVVYRDYHESVPFNKVVQNFSLQFRPYMSVEEFVRRISSLVFDDLEAFGEGDMEEASRTAFCTLFQDIRGQDPRRIMPIYHFTDAPPRILTTDPPVSVSAPHQNQFFCDQLVCMGTPLEEAKYWASRISPNWSEDQKLDYFFQNCDSIKFPSVECKEENLWLTSHRFPLTLVEIKARYFQDIRIVTILTKPTIPWIGIATQTSWNILGETIVVERNVDSSEIQTICSNILNETAKRIPAFLCDLKEAAKSLKTQGLRRVEVERFFIEALERRFIDPEALCGEGGFAMIISVLRSLSPVLYEDVKMFHRNLEEFASRNPELGIYRLLQESKQDSLHEANLFQLAKGVIDGRRFVRAAFRKDGINTFSPSEFSSLLTKGDLKTAQRFINGVLKDVEIVETFVTEEFSVKKMVPLSPSNSLLNIQMLSGLVLGFVLESQKRLVIFAFLLLGVPFLRPFAETFLNEYKGEWFTMRTTISPSGETIVEDSLFLSAPLCRIFLAYRLFLEEEEVWLAERIVFLNQVYRLKQSFQSFELHCGGSNEGRLDCFHCGQEISVSQYGFGGQCTKCTRILRQELQEQQRKEGLPITLTCLYCEKTRGFSKGQTKYRIGLKICFSCMEICKTQSTRQGSEPLTVRVKFPTILLANADIVCRELGIPTTTPLLKDFCEIIDTALTTGSLSELFLKYQVTEKCYILERFIHSMKTFSRTTSLAPLVYQTRLILNSERIWHLLNLFPDMFSERAQRECNICGEQDEAVKATLQMSSCSTCNFSLCLECASEKERQQEILIGKPIQFNAITCWGCRTLPEGGQRVPVHGLSKTILITKEHLFQSKTMAMACCCDCNEVEPSHPLSCQASSEEEEKEENDGTLFRCSSCICCTEKESSGESLPVDPHAPAKCVCGTPYVKDDAELPVDEQNCNHVQCSSCQKHICAFRFCGMDFTTSNDCYDHMRAKHGGFGGRYGGSLCCLCCHRQFSQEEEGVDEFLAHLRNECSFPM